MNHLERAEAEPGKAAEATHLTQAYAHDATHMRGNGDRRRHVRTGRAVTSERPQLFARQRMEIRLHRRLGPHESRPGHGDEQVTRGSASPLPCDRSVETDMRAGVSQAYQRTVSLVRRIA